jgi:D-alanyl-D-alanine carboxypeptidase
MRKPLKKLIFIVIVFACASVITFFIKTQGRFQNISDGQNISGEINNSDTGSDSTGSDKPAEPEKTNAPEKGTTENKETSNTKTSGLVKNPSDIFVLVNKNHYLDPGFMPKDLVKLNITFAPEATQEERMMRKEAADALKTMFAEGRKENILLRGVSGYRSYKSQKQVYDQNLKAKGRDYVESFVAYPGQSEHQTGLSIDVGAVNNTQNFGTSKEGKWLQKNANKYGFILRYPKEKENITGYSYEPWHIRYVGKKAAGQIYSRGIVLEEYLQ